MHDHFLSTKRNVDSQRIPTHGNKREGSLGSQLHRSFVTAQVCSFGLRVRWFSYSVRHWQSFYLHHFNGACPLLDELISERGPSLEGLTAS